ncbi:MAG: YkgJ family cysteine cluster protein [Thermoproteota archaeon]|nr:MAG: YkgJ family cysteine cluster protein [Candidatus Korarchaeota archaeon]
MVDSVRCVPDCYLCCVETDMILTKEDVKNLLALGYELEEFSEYRDGYLRLKNKNGMCFFLNERGACRVYENRPIGCRAYPVIYDVEEGKCKIDEECPAGDTVGPEEFLEKCKLIIRALPQLIRSENSGSSVNVKHET